MCCSTLHGATSSALQRELRLHGMQRETKQHTTNESTAMLVCHYPLWTRRRTAASQRRYADRCDRWPRQRPKSASARRHNETRSGAPARSGSNPSSSLSIFNACAGITAVPVSARAVCVERSEQPVCIRTHHARPLRAFETANSSESTNSCQHALPSAAQASQLVVCEQPAS